MDSELDCDVDDPEFCAPPLVRNQITEKIIHEHYRAASKDQHFDIALLRLESKVEFNEFVKPICLPLDPTMWAKDYTNYTFEVAG